MSSVRFPLECAVVVPAGAAEVAVVFSGLTVVLDGTEAAVLEDDEVVALPGSTPSVCPSCLLSAKPILAFAWS